MKIAIHQPNFVPWLPFFYKMAMADKFIILENVQFEKNGYQNRFMYKGKWITKPVQSGVDLIKNKDYVGLSGTYVGGKKISGSVSDLNMLWIRAIKDTLDIKTDLLSDYMISSQQGTDRLISLVKENNGTVYITNPEAKSKYLNEDKFKDNGIDIEYCNVPKNLNISIFEAFEKFGIEGLKKQLPRKK